MKSIAKPGSFGYSRSATDERFTKNWLTDYAKLNGVNRVAYGNQTRVVASATCAICTSDSFKVFASKQSGCKGLSLEFSHSSLGGENQPSVVIRVSWVELARVFKAG
jgi:hypothetical protein